MNFLLGLERASLFGLAGIVVALIGQKRLDGRVPAAWRVWLWRVALLQCVLAVAPIVPLRLAVLPARGMAASAPVLARDVAAPPELPGAPRKNSRQTASATGAAASATAPSTEVTELATPRAEAQAMSSSWNQRLCLALGALWALGVALQVVTLGRSFWRLRRWLGAGTLARDAEVELQLRAIARRMQSPCPQLVCAAVGAPFLTGVFRPRIVMPGAVFRADAAQREAILSHELAHLKRRDLLWNAILWLVQTAFWFHPLVWLSRHFLPLETESACDEMVLEAAHISPNFYGALLLNTPSLDLLPRAGVLTAGVGDGFSTLKTRLMRLKQTRRRPKTALKIGLATAAAAALLSAYPFRLVARSQTALAQGSTVKPVVDKVDKQAAASKKALIAKIGAVSGRVVTPDGKPIGGARVSWLGYAGEVDFSSDGVVLATVSSDASGRFRFPASPGLLSRSLKFAGTRSVSKPPQLLIEAAGHGLTAAPLLKFDVDTEIWARATLAPIRLADATQLQTSFRTATGQPVSGLKVRLNILVFFAPGRKVEQAAYIMLPRQMARLTARTDASGVARFAALPQGASARLQIDDDRFAQLNYATGNVDLARGLQTLAHPIRLETGASVSGRVVDGESGKPVMGIHVGAQSLNRGATGGGGAVTDRDGHYRITMLPAAAYNLALGLDEKMSLSRTARAHENVAVSPGDALKNLDFELIPGALISGRVSAQKSGEPVAGLDIGIYGPAHPGSGAWVQSATTDANGSYQLRVPSGQQRIYFMSQIPRGFGAPTDPPTASVPLSSPSNPSQTTYEFTVADGQSATISWQLPTVRVARATPIEVLNSRGMAAAGAEIEVSSQKSALPSPEDVVKLRADSQGRATIANATEKTRIRVRSEGESQGEATPRAVAVTLNQKLIVRLQPRQVAGLTGRVVDSSGHGLFSATINLFRQEGDYGLISDTVNVDKTGSFAFPHLWPDLTYSLSVSAPGYGRKSVEMMQPRPGETRVLKPLILQRAESFVEGRVVDEAGKPVVGLTLDIVGGQIDNRSALTDRRGHFRVNAVVAGDTVIIQSRAGDRYVSTQARAGTSDTVIVLTSRP